MCTKFLLILFVLININISYIYAESKLKFNQTVYLLIGLPAGPHSQDFFDVYKKIVGGTKSNLKPTPLLGVGTKFNLYEKYKLGLLGCFYETNFNDMYGQKIYPNPESPERWVSEQIIIDNYPLFITIDYNPYQKSQFNTYAGLGIGCNFGKVNWTENVLATQPQDIRKGGILVNENTFSLITRTYLGMELGFDKKTKRYLLGGIHCEVSYIYDTRRMKMFDKLKNQFYVKYPEFDEKYPIIPGIFELSMAISLVFE